jgi:hypothetical protein
MSVVPRHFIVFALHFGAPVSFSVRLNLGHKIIEEKCDAFIVDVYSFTWQVNRMLKTCIQQAPVRILVGLPVTLSGFPWVFSVCLGRIGPDHFLPNIYLSTIHDHLPI